MKANGHRKISFPVSLHFFGNFCYLFRLRVRFDVPQLDQRPPDGFFKAAVIIDHAPGQTRQFFGVIHIIRVLLQLDEFPDVLFHIFRNFFFVVMYGILRANSVTDSAANANRWIDHQNMVFDADCIGRTVLHADCTAGALFRVNPGHGVSLIFVFGEVPDDFFLRQNVFDFLYKANSFQHETSLFSENGIRTIVGGGSRGRTQSDAEANRCEPRNICRCRPFGIR
jgi:hypothetical protein